MSFILDALRKSELERQRKAAPHIAEIPVARPDRRLPIALAAVGVLLAANIAVVLFFVLRDVRAPAPPAEASAAPAGATAAAPAAAEPARPLPRAVAPASDYVPGEELPPDPPPDALPDYAAATLPPDAPDPTLIPTAPAGPGEVNYGQAVARIDDLPAHATAGLPALSVDLHVYADDPAKRAVFINGRRYTQGTQLAEGPVVEEITRDGAILSYRGNRFLLPRL